ncbi:PTS glucitol/sorbitol transporter subunit IIC [Niallia circulans]|jgi:glucitol/sorbitol PTS system EIIC component|uniref:PTS system glucitol/sorbitol-specific transporter subunit IIC n=1 Tax=Niallia circulans TaxID=1397 RepID=A0A0J1IJP0_NIACI|nr:PTS glucitol/sorbitol transporter subunit IIC [Niallia circulans]SLK40467.1 PTS system glucitol/sorbitol-specific EIIC component [Mycobacteroides abscessus subsp. abscessus]KLV26176.1 PTS system glucitol/sorbitol-specific transporter subunit IIC [Niallia circulans]MCM2982648.1 PTS glucitol/sorbitol transporter subunit IIC [Niallia circulans]NRG34456.1 PTS glucitol/sorbitol transporter subunit IIC [Niallia circulans]PAD24896.1 PTS glucitol/sorbitol transporter subunit IIC [Niallia circulans]
MDYIIKFAEGFRNLFDTGAETFISWMTGIVPVVLLLLVAMNTIIQLIGENRINRLASASSKNPLLRYLVLPLLGTFMLGNPMGLSLGRFLPEKYKPSYYASASYFCHTSNGLFPHINPGELFIFLGIAAGIEQLGFSTADLAVRYFLVGLVMNFFAGWITDFTTKMVEKQQGIKLNSEVKLNH